MSKMALDDLDCGISILIGFHHCVVLGNAELLAGVFFWS